MEQLFCVPVNSGSKTLLPADAFYKYIPQDFKIKLTHWEATHHGSCHSILYDDTGSDIPPFCSRPLAALSAETVYFFYGAGNQHGHCIANVANQY